MKILLLLDAMKFNKEQLEFPAYISQIGKGTLTALFLENLYDSDTVLVKYSDLAVSKNPYREDLDKKKALIEKNIRLYTQACKEIGLSGSLMRAGELMVKETIDASRFADLLLISPNLSFEVGNEIIPTRFAEDVLSETQCPAIVMPVLMREIKEVYFTYNGSYSSVYAIRQFTNLFPLLRDSKVTVLYVPENNEENMIHTEYIKEYLRHHYSTVEFKILSGNPKNAIFSYLVKQKDCLVTFGAYGRSKFSQFFKKSKAESILKTLDMPVFITHP